MHHFVILFCQGLLVAFIKFINIWTAASHVNASSSLLAFPFSYDPITFVHEKAITLFSTPTISKMVTLIVLCFVVLHFNINAYICRLHSFYAHSITATFRQSQLKNRFLNSYVLTKASQEKMTLCSLQGELCQKKVQPACPH